MMMTYIAHTFLYCCHVTNIIFIIRRALKLHVLYVQICGLLKKSSEVVVIFRRSESECRTNFSEIISLRTSNMPSYSSLANINRRNNLKLTTGVWQIKTPDVTKLLCSKSEKKTKQICVFV